LIAPSSEDGNNTNQIFGERNTKVRMSKKSGSVRANTLDFLLAINFDKRV
jgi:hypothetical protein